MTVMHLNHEHFQAPGGATMKLNIPGLVLVMFKQQTCQHCVNFAPQFEAMSQNDQRVRFAYIDIRQNRQVIGMAQTTNTPIKAVPLFILYLNGVPCALYKGRHEYGSMMSFLNELVQKVGAASTSNFVQPRQPNINASRPISAATQQQYGNLGPSRQDLEMQKEMESKMIPDGLTPYNVPYLSYVLK